MDAYGKQERIEGWQLDRVARTYIGSQGFGEYFMHSPGRNIHARSANLDDYEMRDRRPLILGTTFPIEQGL